MNVTVTLRAKDLREIVAENRRIHQLDYNNAVLIWTDEAKGKLLELHERVARGAIERLYVNLPLPEEHLNDYDRVIRMLAMHSPATIVLDEQDYSAFVDDDWDWKRQWRGTTGSYVGKGA